MSLCLYVCIYERLCMAQPAYSHAYDCLCLPLCTCMPLCLYVSIYECLCIAQPASPHGCLCLPLCTCMPLCLYVCVYDRLCMAQPAYSHAYDSLCLPLCTCMPVCLYVCVFVCLKFGSISNFLDNRVGDSCAGGGFCSRGRGNTLRGRL